jgi:hypothetical protein
MRHINVNDDQCASSVRSWGTGRSKLRLCVLNGGCSSDGRCLRKVGKLLVLMAILVCQTVSRPHYRRAPCNLRSSFPYTLIPYLALKTASAARCYNPPAIISLRCPSIVVSEPTVNHCQMLRQKCRFSWKYHILSNVGQARSVVI